MERHMGMVWAVARSHRLSDADAADVVQTTWLRLVEHLDRLQDPERVGAWLVTTARREALKSISRSARQQPTEPEQLDVVADEPDLGRGLFLRERDRRLWAAFERLSQSCQELLRLLMADPPPAYEDVADALGRPIGSLGPTRARCLAKLRRDVESAGITPELSGS